jgi:hypothetical protein
MSVSTSMLRVFEPYPGLYAYYDGRVEGRRLYSDAPNWLDDGAYSLGIASYAIVDQGEALVYDTHMSLSHGRAIRSHLEGLGVGSIRVVLSHWHDDHIAGNEIFADCEIATHISELARMRTWPIRRILPNHGDPGRIAAGGYSARLVDANRSYLERLTDPDERGRCEGMSLRDFIADDIASGAVLFFQPYEAVHRENISAVKAVSQRPS